MSKFEFEIDVGALQAGLILQKSYFRYSISTTVSVHKLHESPLILFQLLGLEQRLEVHPNSIDELIKIEDTYTYYILLKKRPTLSIKEKDYWNSGILEFHNEDPFIQILYPHFLTLKLEFAEEPLSLLIYLKKNNIRTHLGYYQDVSYTDFPLNLTKLLWILPWSTKYSLFVLLTNRKMTLDDLNAENIQLLSRIPNCSTHLEQLYLRNKTFSIKRLTNLSMKFTEPQKLPPGHVSIRKILISPSTFTFMPHEVDLGNRVVRDLNSDLLIRVNFVDEYNERNIWSNCEAVLSKFKKILKGFSFLGRYFEFLGFSNSQMRNHSCWMVHCNRHISADALREQLGSFEKCKTVCKFASRLGLCFSGTYGAVEVDSDRIYLMEDIKNELYVFSDGVGMISPDLFQKALSKINVKENQKISALQVRIGGSKGVLTCTPEIENSIYVRPSMNKFKSDYIKLELCSYAASHPGYLNRQIIIILSGLGVADEVFLNLQKSMIAELKTTLSSEAAAELNLRKTNPSYYRDLIYMLSNSMKISEDIYLRNMINAIFLANVKLIKSKARILVPDSRLLMGVLDEYAALEYGEVFLQISEEDSSEIITGRVAVAKNPCYHPGDIRILQAVDNINLRHLHNVVVFPQKGQRPHPNECSGSDLDGDLYFLTWSPKLVPAKQEEPMDYNSPNENPQENPCDIDKVIDFFGTFMQSENIGRISNAHLVWADKLGVKSKEAITLAKLTSVAVDYPKTGIPAVMPNELKIRAWPDFMEKTGKSSYVSDGIIGNLWRACVLDTVKFKEDCAINKNFVVKGYENYLGFAKTLYAVYAGKMNKLISQYDCENELFALTGQSGENSKKKMRYEDNIQIQSLVSFYKEEVHKLFREKTQNLIERRKIASACYVLAYNKKIMSQQKATFISFPWIFYDYLL